MEIGITGLPGAGKTVVFNALSRAKVPTANYSARANEPNRAVVKVPDKRLEQLATLFRPRKVTPAEVRYVDVAGLMQGAGADDRGAQLLAQLRTADALLIVVRAFVNEVVAHPLGTADPHRDLDMLATELMVADLDVVEKRLARLDKELAHPKGSVAEQQRLAREQVLLKGIHAALADGRPGRVVEMDESDERLLRGYGLLTLKPWLIALNTDDGGIDAGVVERLREQWQHAESEVVAIAGRLEMDIAELGTEEVGEFLDAWNLAEPALDRVIRDSYRLLDLVSFFTVGEDEVRAWPVPRGASALDAAAVIHTSIAKAFIRAEVVPNDALLACGSLQEARKRGLLRSEGRAYTIQDGDVAHFLHNA